MVLIAHRGNIQGSNHEMENKPAYIKEALSKGFYVEIDVWLKQDEELYLGHDNPQYPTTLEFIQHDSHIICHAKTISTFQYLLTHGLHCFFHDTDAATLTSQNKIWLYPGTPPQCPSGILVMPEWKSIDYKGETWIQFIRDKHGSYYGICSDYVELIRDTIY